MTKRRFEGLLIDTLNMYKRGEVFNFDSPICKAAVGENGRLNCYRCPLNVTAIEEMPDDGCLARRNAEPARKEMLPKAIKFYEALLKVVHLHPLQELSYHGKTRSSWATAVRTIDMIV